MARIHDPSDLPDEFLVHYGVKGMRWGIRRQDVASAGRSAADIAKHNADTKMYMDAARRVSKGPQSHAEGLAQLAANQKKFEKKFVDETDSGSSSGLSPETKAALLAGAGVAAGLGAAYYLKNRSVPFDAKAVKDLAGKNTPPDSGDLWSTGFSNIKAVDDLAGKPIDPDQFNGLVSMSQGKTWYGDNYINDSAFARPAFELPAGHEFHRITTSDSTSHRATTYALHSRDDFNRYVAGFRSEAGKDHVLNHVTWKTTAPTKVPDLTTVLGGLHSVMSEGGRRVSADDVVREYKSISGGMWKTTNSVKLIQKLQDQGYGALVDEMDAGVIGETPLVFFNSRKSTPKTVTPFTKDSIARAEALLKEINKPPGRKY